jgi:hypothetical protein
MLLLFAPGAPREEYFEILAEWALTGHRPSAEAGTDTRSPTRSPASSLRRSPASASASTGTTSR